MDLRSKYFLEMEKGVMEKNIVNFLMPFIVLFIVCKAGLSDEFSDAEKTSLNYKTGVKYVTQERYSDAEEEFKKDLEIDKFSLKTRSALKLIDDLKKGERNKDSILFFFKGLDRAFSTTKPSQKEIIQEAINYLQKSIELDPNFIEANYKLALYYGVLGERQQAIYYCQKIIELNPRDPLAFLEVGETYLILNERQKSIDYFKKAIEIDFDCIEAYWALALSCIIMNDYQEAMKSFQKIQQIDQNNPSGFFWLGQVYIASNQHEKALKELKKAKELFQNRGDSKGIRVTEKSIKIANMLISAGKKYSKKDEPIDKSSLWTARMMFFGGIFILLSLSVGLLVFFYILLPKRGKAKTCPVERFRYAKKILIPLPRGKNIIVNPDSKIFTELIGNFTDEVKPPSEYVSSVTLYIKTGNRKYALGLSLDGWNFKGEEPNCRILRDPMQVMLAIDSLKEVYQAQSGRGAYR